MDDVISDFPLNRQFYSDFYKVMRSEKNYVKGLLEIDITKSIRLIRSYKEDGHDISITGWIISCLAQAIRKYPIMNTYRKGRAKQVTFGDIDVITFIEHEVEGQQLPIPHTIRRADELDIDQITTKIRQFQSQEVTMDDQLLGKPRLIKFLSYFPGFIRRFIIKLFMKNPHTIKESGTVALTSLGMFADHIGWPINTGVTTLVVAVGSINSRIKKINDDLVEREIITITLQVDHDIVDGSVATEFADHFASLLGDDQRLHPMMT